MSWKHAMPVNLKTLLHPAFCQCRERLEGIVEKVTFPVKCLENWVFFARTCPTKPLPPPCHPDPSPPLLATLVTHSVAVLLGRPYFLYFNICSLSWMKNWKCIYNQRFDSPPYQLPCSPLFIYFWQASCNKLLFWWVKYSPQAKQWAELRTGCRI